MFGIMWDNIYKKFQIRFFPEEWQMQYFYNQQSHLQIHNLLACNKLNIFSSVN